MNKKLLLFASTLLLALGALAADFQSGDLYFNILTEPADGNPGTVEVAPPPSGAYQLSSASGYTFPETVTYNGNTYNVTAIGVRAFKDARFSSSNSSKVYPMMWLGNNLVEIKAEAFMGCQLNLTGFRAALTTIDPSAYRDNKINWFNSNNSIYTSDGSGVILTQNGTHLAFFGGVHCSGTAGGSNFVTSYTVASAIVAIDDYAFSGNSKITTLNLGSVQSIGKESCARMTALKTLTIPATATTIDPDAFLETDGITTLNVKLTEPVPGVKFEDAVYERLRDHVNFAADANIEAFKADPDWGKFFSKTYPKLYLAGSFTNWATDKLEMTADQDGNYSLTVENVPNGAEFKFVNEDNSVWYGGATGDATYRVHMGWCTDIELSTTGSNFIIDGTGTLTFNVSSDMKLSITGWSTGVYLIGTMTNNWADRVEMAADNGKFTITQEMVAGDEFKIVDLYNTWYGATSGNGQVTDTMLGQELTVASPGDNFQMTTAGEYILTFDKDNMKLTIEPRPIDTTPFMAGKLYYKPVSETEVEITPDPSGVPYNIELDNANEITDQVTHPDNGKVYTVIGIGEGAFKDGSIKTKASVSAAARTMGYFFFPATITYIRANAFNNCQSNYPGIRLANMTTIDDQAFVNNKINWFNTAMSGSVFKVYGDNSTTGNHTGGLLYKEVDGVKTLVCYPGDHHKTAYILMPGDFSDNPNFVLTVNADLSFYNVIGPYAMYNNKNIRTITLGSGTTAIETNAFVGATAITSITCNATVPPTGAVFEDAVIAACKDKLVIPAGSEAAYRADENWGKFFSPVYEIVIAETENGTVTADKEFAKEGETVTLTVAPAEGYELDELEVIAGADTPVETTLNTETGKYTFTMPAEIVSVVATFKPLAPTTFAITIADGIEHGTVEADKAEALEGETVTLTATPAEGYELTALTYTVEGADPVNIENNAFQMPAAPVTINATFTAIDYTITVAETEHGTVTAPATAHFGDNVTLTVAPAEGYELASLTYTVEGAEPVAIENLTFTMPAANVTINATFQPLPVVLDGVAFASNVYASWYGNADLALPEGVTAYVVTGIEDDATVIEPVGYIPAGVGVLLYSTTPAEAVSTMPYTGETATVTSMLQGGLEEMAITDGYVLYGDEFVRTLGGTLAAHRCYLPMPADAAGAPRLRIVGNGEVVTAIADIDAARSGKVTYVDPMGRVSDKPFQGINIVIDGNKVSKMVK